MLATACFDGPLDEKGNRGRIGTDYFLSGQRYSGQYLLESRHGRGACLYPDGFKYLGYLYAGAAEFCGTANCPSGAYYQGLFSAGQPHGPGQITYPDGSRDSGVWSRGRLVRLLTQSPAAVPFNMLLTGHYIGWYDRRVLVVKEPETAVETALRTVNGDKEPADYSPQQLDRLTNLQLRDRHCAAFPTHRYRGATRQLPVVRMMAWNDTDVICDVQAHAYRTEKGGRMDAEVVGVQLEELMRPGRVQQLRTGRLQRASRLLLHASALDRADVIRLLLRTVRLSADVMDSTGATGLICAVMRGHMSAVNTLLDHGADVNHVTDEGMTALSVCLALHHPDFATKYHLDQLTVFSYPGLTEEYADVVEWRGGASVPFERGERPFPRRPLVAGRTTKARRRTRSSKRSGQRPEPPADIRMALVPGPSVWADEQEPADTAPRRSRTGRAGDDQRRASDRRRLSSGRGEATTRGSVVSRRSAQRADSSAERADSPGKRPDSPGKRPDSPGKRPDSPGKRPDSPGKRPDSSGKRPDSLVQRADSSAECPDSSAECPDSSAECPDSSAECPDSSAECPDSSAERPNSSGKRPDSSGKRPDSPGKRPDSSGKRPDSSGKRLDSLVQLPDSSAERPDSSAERPDSSAERPDSSGKRPGPVGSDSSLQPSGSPGQRIGSPGLRPGSPAQQPDSSRRRSDSSGGRPGSPAPEPGSSEVRIGWSGLLDGGDGPSAAVDVSGGEAPEDAVPPSWSAVQLDDGQAQPRSSLAQLETARTDLGLDSGWQRLPAAGLRCCPSLDQMVATAADRPTSDQETAVRLIEAFCSGTHGSWEDTAYSTPSPGTVNMLPMLKLLLRRGADPEASKVPFPAVHLALLADNKPLLVKLLTVGGDVNSRLSSQLGGLAPLHVACTLPGEDRLAMTQLLLAHGADPNVTCDPGTALLNLDVLERRRLPQPQQLGSRTPLHVACQQIGTTYRDRVTARMLLDQLDEAGADVEALCNGHTPMTLALACGDMTLAVDLMTRGACTKRELGPPHYDALGLAVSPAVEAVFELEDRKQLIRTLLAYGSELLREYPLPPEAQTRPSQSAGSRTLQSPEEDRTGNILDFAIWINNTDDHLLTCAPHQLKGKQRPQKKSREAFLQFLRELVDDELLRHELMMPLVTGGLYEDAEELEQDGTAARNKRKRKIWKRVLLSPDCFCPLCDRVLGKCFKDCPNYGTKRPKLTAAPSFHPSGDDGLEQPGMSSGEDRSAGEKDGRRHRRRKRRAEAGHDADGIRLEVGALLDENGKPLRCDACHKVIRRRRVLCSACRKAMYCSKQCRSSDWEKQHSLSCPARSRVAMYHVQSSTSQLSQGTRLTSAGATDSSEDGLRMSPSGHRSGGQGHGRRPGDTSGHGRRGRSLGADGRAAGCRCSRARARGAQSLDSGDHHQAALTPMKMPPGMAAFLSQFRGLHVGDCRHLVLGEWYEYDCKTQQNYSFI